MLQHVRILAEVPRNPLGLETPIRFSEVSSFSGSNKKKSSEIAVGVDGHSIGIYDVRSISHYIDNAYDILGTIWKYRYLLCNLSNNGPHLPALRNKA